MLEEYCMFNMNNKKTKKLVSTIIVIVLALAMIVPTIVAAVGGLF